MQKKRGLSYSFVLAASAVSTALSCLFLVIAALGSQWPPWEKVVGTRSVINLPGAFVLKITDAIVLIQILAKIVEVTFVSVYLHFLGQWISRTALSKRGEESTRLAQLCMRDWILQPGGFFFQGRVVRILVRTGLFWLTLLALIVSLGYTTAVAALVTPRLKSLAEQSQSLTVDVATVYANISHLRSVCATPIDMTVSSGNRRGFEISELCLVMSGAASGYVSNDGLQRRWVEAIRTNESVSVEPSARPAGFEISESNTNVTSTWLYSGDCKAAADLYGRIIDNVTLVVPHPSIMAAALNAKNQLLQPEDLDGRGTYRLRAALPSPYVNVQCASANTSELVHIVYESQPGVQLKLIQDVANNGTWWHTNGIDWTWFRTVRTALDDVFGWNGETRPRPVFYKFPSPYNSVMNRTRTSSATDAFYVLVKARPNEIDGYAICSIHSGLTQDCLTMYSAAVGGNSLSLNCNDPRDRWQYEAWNNSLSQTRSPEWYDVGEKFAHSQLLDAGVFDAYNPIAEYLSNLALDSPCPSNLQPSPAEVLASLMAPSLWASAKDSPVEDFWEPSVSASHQQFEASLTTVGYRSGGEYAWQKGFIIILALAFALNVFLLLYLTCIRGLVTDITDVDNAFVMALAATAPPARVRIQRADGTPASALYKHRWSVQSVGVRQKINMGW